MYNHFRVLIAVAVVALTVTVTPTAPAATVPVGQRVALPSFVLDAFQGGEVDLNDYRGRVVLVNFWATWCPPCVKEFPSLVALKKTLAGEPVEILAVNMGESDAAIAGFVERLGGVNFPLLVDRPTITVAETWPVRALPTTIVVDKSGRLALHFRGERDWDGAGARAMLRALMRE